MWELHFNNGANFNILYIYYLCIDNKRFAEFRDENIYAIAISIKNKFSVVMVEFIYLLNYSLNSIDISNNCTIELSSLLLIIQGL